MLCKQILIKLWNVAKISQILIFFLQKYSDAIELNAYDAEFYLKRAAAFMKLTNYQGNQWTQFF